MTPTPEMLADARAAGRIIAAPMSGKCYDCKRTINKGELILFGKGRMLHEDCSNPTGVVHTQAKIEFHSLLDYKEFDSIAEYRDYAFADKSMWKHIFNFHEMESVRRDRYGHNSKEWHGVHGGAAEVERITQTGGWEEGARIVEDLTSYIDLPPPVSIRRRRIRADQGDSLDIHSVLSGNLDKAWERPVRRGGLGQQNIRLIASMQGTGGLKARTYLWRGAACLALCDMLTTAGYNVEIWGEYRCAGFGGYRSNPDDKIKNPLVHRVRFKDGKTPIDVSSLASAVCLAGFKRVIGFSAMQRHLDGYDIQSVSNGSWRSIEVCERGPNEIAGFDKFDGYGDDEKEREGAKAAVATALERVEVFHNVTRESLEAR